MTPSALAVYFSNEQEFLYVVDSSNCTISKYTSGGEHKSEWGGKGNSDNQISAPASIFVTKDEDIYVADSGNDRIVKMTYWNMPDNIKINDKSSDNKSKDKNSSGIGEENNSNSTNTLIPQVDVKPDEVPIEEKVDPKAKDSKKDDNSSRVFY